MVDLARFREQVTIYRKRQVDLATGRPYTLEALAKGIGLSADELGHRLRGTGRSKLTPENVLAIVHTLAEWGTLTWNEALELLVCMDYPLDSSGWQTKLQRVLGPPPQSVHQTTASRVASQGEESSLPVRRRLFQARDLPKGYVPRLQPFNEIKRLLLTHEDNQTTAITTALRGAGGFGKTTLASALCHDSEIQAAFPDGILWVELGEQPPRTLDLLNRLLAFLERSHTDAVLLQEAQERWRAVLHGRVCLLVIDDVWQAEALLPLLEGGPHCRRLVTTRNDLLLPRDIARVLVDAMEPQEAVAVLCQGLPEVIHQAASQSNLEALAARLGCWPLLLTLANGMLVDLVDAHLSITEALTTVSEAYQTRGVTAFRLDNVEQRQQTVNTCLKVSLEHLETFTPPHYQARERYQELAVFPEDTDIPQATLQVYWKERAGLQSWETKDLCLRLYRLSLLLTCDLGTGMIRLHDVVRSYLIQRAGEQLPILHQRLLQAFQQHYHLAHWANLPQSEDYLWQRLAFHLYQAGNQEALQTTFTDLWYVIHKVQYTGVSALEADLTFARTSLQNEDTGQPSPLLVLLHRTVMYISHLLHQASSEVEIGGLLLSYLQKEKVLTTRCLALEQELPRPFLTSWHSLPRASSALLRTLQGHTHTVNACAFSPDGQWIVSASDDHTLKVWDIATGEERRSLRGHADGVSGCAVSPDGRFIVSASDDRTLKVWEAATGAKYLTLTGHSSQVLACAFSPDGQWIVSASRDGTLKVWEAATGAERLTLSGHTGTVYNCAFSPDGQWIVSASHDETLKVWEAATGAEHLILTGHAFGVRACAFSPDGQWIVSASDDRTLKVWEASTGAEHLTLTGHAFGVKACAFSPDGQWIVSSSSDRTLKVWDIATGEERRSLRSHTRAVLGCAFSPDSNFIISASEDQTLAVWEATTGEERHTLRGHTHSVNGCAFSFDGTWVASASYDETLKVWEAATGEERRTLRGHTGLVYGCAFSPDGQWIVSASDDRTLKVWKVATGEERHTLRGHTSEVKDCVFSPDGQWIVSASNDGTLKIWKAATGAERRTLKGHFAVNGCAFSPDGQWIVSASQDKTLKVWEATTGAERHTLTGHTGPVYGCAFSPDGTRIVSASQDHTLKVWEAATGVEHLTLSGHTHGVEGCAFSPDGQWVVSASQDHTLKVWEARSGRHVLTFPVDKALFGCIFHPDGEHLVACGVQGMYFLRLVK